MNYNSYGDFETFMHDTAGDRIFSMVEYKRMFTPYEQEKKFQDESIYMTDEYQEVVIREVIELPNGELLLGMQYLFDYYDLEEEKPNIYYHNLKDISLSYIPMRENIYMDCECEDEDNDDEED